MKILLVVLPLLWTLVHSQCATTFQTVNVSGSLLYFSDPLRPATYETFGLTTHAFRWENATLQCVACLGPNALLADISTRMVLDAKQTLEPTTVRCCCTVSYEIGLDWSVQLRWFGT